ncbi:MAG: ATP-binding protein [Planctomycetes bacterium]|nr:ATP-binding protein [Planctomycetota bacterium]
MLRLRAGAFRNKFWLANVTIALSLVLLLTLTVWQSVADLHSLRNDLLREEILVVRAEAVRTAARVEQSLKSVGDANLDDLGKTAEALAWLRKDVDRRDVRYPYAAIVDSGGTVVWHTDPSQRGKHLRREWYESVAYEVGTDVVRTRSPVLSTGVLAYDVHVPILANGEEVGTYHIGLSQAWFAQRFADAKRQFLLERSLSVGAVFLVVVAAAASLYAISRRTQMLKTTVTRTYMRAASELGRLAAGLAHEIRNPLQALRLNLHTFRRTQQDSQMLEPAEIARMLDQSSAEIDRIDTLLSQLINFATPAKPRAEAFSLNSELEGVVDFISQELRRSDIDVHVDLPKSPVSIRMDRARLRQIMLNLLHNARDSMPDGGRIDVAITRKDPHVEIVVSDQGGGIAEADLPHIFEPFFTTSVDGSGLGLALVKRFVEEAGGEICCEANQPHGTRFRVRLTEAISAGHHRGVRA